jgi:hypothetical protein
MHFITWIPVLIVLLIIIMIPIWCISIAILKDREKKLADKVYKKVIKEISKIKM